MGKASILIIDDDVALMKVLKEFLESADYEVDTCADGLAAIDMIQTEKYDLFVIDRMLPQISGIQVCDFIRKYRHTRYLPILMSTALGKSEEVVEGLASGADDYISKPFDLAIFKARIESLLRRVNFTSRLEGQFDNVIVFDKVKIDTDQFKVWVDGEEVSLTVSEYRILCYLIQNAYKVVSRAKLIEEVKGDQVFITERTIDTHIFGLRKKIKSAANIIETIRGIGYRVKSD
jgi:DNA-binding response OmpR family regulator